LVGTEQTAIAKVLSDMDPEIAALERRLAKTRDLKRGNPRNYAREERGLV